MREIKFRGKNKDIGWIYGQLVYDKNGNPYIIQEVEQDSSYGLEETMLYATMWYRVDPETIGQYTGLKDKNGKEIYEGDIVEWNYRGINKAVVFWDSIKAGFFITPTHCYKWRMEEHSHIRAEFLNAKNKKVIGNIYENSNLLEY